MTARVKVAVVEVLGASRALRRAALRRAAARGRSLVLVYHRTAPDGPELDEVVQTLPTTLLRRQLEALGDMGDVVSLARLLDPPDTRARVRFGISFDDDDRGHVRHALPVLLRLGAPATFFLSGRSLHGLPPYWWEVLERAIGEHGLARTARMLGISAETPQQLAAACETREPETVVRALGPAPGLGALTAHDIGALARAGMELGFHTLEHPVLTRLGDAALDRALHVGRHELSAAAGRDVRLLAYPHGRADRRVARRAERAGYRAAFVTRARPIDAGADPFFLGRWEPGALEIDEFVAAVALRLNLPPAAP